MGTLYLLVPKVRKGGNVPFFVTEMAVLVVCGVNLDGKREILAVEPMFEESEASYTALFDSLKARGLRNVWLAVSDAHQGLVMPYENRSSDVAGNGASVGMKKDIKKRGERNHPKEMEIYTEYLTETLY